MWCLAFGFTITLYGPLPHMGHIPNLSHFASIPILLVVVTLSIRGTKLVSDVTGVSKTL